MSKKIVWLQISQENTVIKGAVEALKGVDNLTEANRYFCELCESVSGFEKLSNNVYRYRVFSLMSANGCLWPLTQKVCEVLRT